MKSYYFIIAIIISLLTVTDASSQMWKRHRYELTGGIGTANFMGDLGGGDKEPARFLGIRDLDLASTRPSVQLGLRYKLYEFVAIRANLGYNLLHGDDAFSANEGRKTRNLSFRSHTFEFSMQFEFYILKDRGQRFISQETKFLHNLSVYLLGGAGIFYYNPKAQYYGQWYELQPLGTEGQDIPESGLERYKRYAFCFPMGIGFKYNLKRRYGISLEISNRYTTTDYIDDVSIAYYDNQAIYQHNTELYGEEFGKAAAALADRHIPKEGQAFEPYPSGHPIRGQEEYKDTYVLFTIGVYYQLTTTRRGLPKF